ncbi:S8 family serine peptidase [Pontibacter locisalis]|uniref:S8 family serine peptidase n=1 Tax=Pontibacter locisalis TaxID=1719035 RepID=A0ABW5IKM8_9BACT
MFTDRTMLRRFLYLFFALLLHAPFLFAQKAKGVGTATKPYTVVYKLKQQDEHQRTSSEALQLTLQRVGAAGVKRKFPHVNVSQNARRAGSPELSRIYELKYSPQLSFEKVKNLLLATGQVDYVEPLYERVPLHQPNDPAADSTLTTQFYLKLIGAYEAWGVEKGDTNVVIGVLDTGFRLTHQDLDTKVKRNYRDPIDGLDNDGDGYVDNFAGWDFGDWDNDVVDNQLYGGHGTSVAAAAAAAANNSVGMAGVGYNIKFLPLKVFNSTPQGGFGGYEAIVYAADKGCKVINLSWGGQGFSQYEQDIINYAVLEKDAVIVAAGGNTPGYVDIYPASYANVLSVGGTDSKDVKHSGYTHSYNIDLAAPSRSVYTASPAGDAGYGNANGTSFGSPIVAACAALVRSKYPELNAWQVIERLRVTTDNIYGLAGNQQYFEMLGRGRVNIKRALKQQQLKSVRCISFELESKYAPPAGSQASINAIFKNYLDPVSNLAITLTSSSPYVTITQNRLAAGSMGTMSSKANTGSLFTFSVAENTPANTLIPFRLSYKDGTYEDFQYFVVMVNPDYVALDANNLEVTVNSKGNFGYNGFNFTQGEGIKYKKGNPLLFEGGLMISTSATQVSDNLRSQMWKNDEDFIPVSIAKRHLNTPLATQEIRSLMHDGHTSPDEAKVGVQVKQISYAWQDAANQNFVILEYHIKNTTDTPFQNLHAGVFADWDIGEHNLNVANWDDENRLGYVHHVSRPLPYAGFKLLTNDSPSYYAIDNLGANDDNLVIEDDFTTAEKYRTLANGIRRKTAGIQGGNNVSHVVGATVNNLAPGETKIVAFAMLVADNLPALKQNAAAAQQKYISFRTSQTPVALADTACAGTNVTWTPERGTRFNFYADSQKQTLLATGPSYTLENFSQQTTIYAAGIDSVFESAAAPATFSLPLAPAADFTYEPTEIFAGQPVAFINNSTNSKEWRWDYGGVTPFTEKNFDYTFNEPGSYPVSLTVVDRFGCTEASVTKVVEVKAASPTGVTGTEDPYFVLYPNPTSGQLYIRYTGNNHLTPQAMPQVSILDITGRNIKPRLEQKSGELVADLSVLPAGVYLAKISYNNTSFIKRIIVTKK